MDNVNSLAHTSCNCKYHIVFAPKYRRRVFFGEKRKEIRQFYDSCVNGKMQESLRQKYAQITYICW